MCAALLACPAGHFDSPGPVVPPEHVQIDAVIGTWWLPERSRLEIRIGEVKASLDYSTAVPQLGVRLSVLKLLARSHFGERVRIGLVGELMVPSNEAPAHVDTAQRKHALRHWGFELVLTPVSL